MNAHVDVTGICITTDRLILRPWSESDLADFYEYASTDGVGQMAGWMPHKSIEETASILQSFITNKKTLALELKETRKVIGSIGIEVGQSQMVDDQLAGRKLGYVLNKNYWGKGLMTEAVKAVTELCFDQFGCDYLLCGHFDRNLRSQRVIQKCGFTFLEEFDEVVHTGAKEHIKRYVLFNHGGNKNV